MAPPQGLAADHRSLSGSLQSGAGPRGVSQCRWRSGALGWCRPAADRPRPAGSRTRRLSWRRGARIPPLNFLVRVLVRGTTFSAAGRAARQQRYAVASRLVRRGQPLALALHPAGTAAPGTSNSVSGWRRMHSRRRRRPPPPVRPLPAGRPRRQPAAPRCRRRRTPPTTCMPPSMRRWRRMRATLGTSPRCPRALGCGAVMPPHAWCMQQVWAGGQVQPPGALASLLPGGWQRPTAALPRCTCLPASLPSLRLTAGCPRTRKPPPPSWPRRPACWRACGWRTPCLRGWTPAWR